MRNKITLFLPLLFFVCFIFLGVGGARAELECQGWINCCDQLECCIGSYTHPDCDYGGECSNSDPVACTGCWGDSTCDTVLRVDYCESYFGGHRCTGAAPETDPGPGCSAGEGLCGVLPGVTPTPTLAPGVTPDPGGGTCEYYTHYTACGYDTCGDVGAYDNCDADELCSYEEGPYCDPRFINWECVEDESCETTVQGRVMFDANNNGSFDEGMEYTVQDTSNILCSGSYYNLNGVSISSTGTENGILDYHTACNPEPYYSAKVGDGVSNLFLNLPAGYAIKAIGSTAGEDGTCSLVGDISCPNQMQIAEVPQAILCDDLSISFGAPFSPQLSTAVTLSSGAGNKKICTKLTNTTNGAFDQCGGLGVKYRPDLPGLFVINVTCEKRRGKLC